MRKSFEDMGITMPQGMVIGMLSVHGEMKISELSKELGLSNSTVSGIIDRLEKQQVVERIRSQTDKRIVHVKLSPHFAKRHHDFHKKAEENFAKLLEKGTPEEIQKIIEGLDALKKVLDKSIQ
ncbi:MAG: MarR family transcriptional regulator [Clostridia bacterium]|nr:MarR family transcriptional regulator [Clostridia bacterium]